MQRFRLGALLLSAPALSSTPNLFLEEQANVSLNFYFKFKLSPKY
jgi:hypothetical protein